jgi:hypothetical protein
MIENLKSMFSQMNDPTRSIAMEHIQTEFRLDATTPIYRDWFIRGEIPEQYQERTVSMFQNLLRQQELRTREIFVHL